MDYPNSQFLVESDWLSEHLSDERIQVLDCTVYLLPTTDPKNNVYDVVSGREDYERSHIPGASFMDIVSEFSEVAEAEATDYPFTVLSKQALAERAARIGLDPGKQIVLYSNARDAGGLFAFRAWWLLRECGFETVSILNGGYAKWLHAELETSSGAIVFPPSQCVVDQGLSHFCAKADVVQALGDSDVVLINSLPQDNFDGTSGHNYGRPGRITGSVNVPMVSTFGPDGCVKPASDLERLFADVGVRDGKKVIAYCGSGIAACVVGFGLALLDFQDVTIYDRSLLEWANDPTLPMETGPVNRPA